MDEKKMHIHVYRITEKYELDVKCLEGDEAISRAKTLAIDKAQAGELKAVESDCEYIALAWMEAENGKYLSV